MFEAVLLVIFNGAERESPLGRQINDAHGNYIRWERVLYLSEDACRAYLLNSYVVPRGYDDKRGKLEYYATCQRVDDLVA